MKMIAYIQKLIDSAAAGTTARFGVLFKDLSTGMEAGVNIGDVFPTASVFKIFVLAELLRQESEGCFSLSDRHTLTVADKSEGSGLLIEMSDGLQPTLLDYAKLMMIISDNTAADFLFRFTGRDSILKNVIQPLGLTCTKCDLTCRDLIAVCYGLEPGLAYGEFDARWSASSKSKSELRNAPAYTGGLELNDETSPRDVSKMLELFYSGKWIDTKHSEIAINIMKACQTNSRIPKYLPDGCSVAHKTGSMLRVANDAGIVYTPKGNFILSCFYNGNTASEEEYEANPLGRTGDELIATLARDICNAYMNNV